MSEKIDAIILGAGAAGLFCAKEIAQQGKKVLILEHNDRPGKKILISGGGRCNFTNLHSSPNDFISENPHFCKSALARFQPQDFLKWVEQNHISYFEKKEGQLFCERSSKEILNLLLQSCTNAKVEIILKCSIEKVSQKPAGFEVETSQGIFQASYLIVATGSLSYPQLGASPLGFEIAEQFGIKVIPPSAALVPFVLKPPDQKQWCSLSGVSLDVEVKVKTKTIRDALLITHRGFSGPAILRISSFWKAGETIEIDLLPQLNSNPFPGFKKKGDSRELKNRLGDFFPRRFAETWCEVHFPSQPLCDLSGEDLEKIFYQLKHWSFIPQATEGYAKAEVSRGGINTNELSSKTLESKKVPGLYFIGEVVDVTGDLGGHNFQWAWASAFACAEGIIQKDNKQ